MDILNIRALMKTRSIYDIPMKVTFYARVSTDRDEQLNSLDNQISYYEEFIKKNARWTFIPGYVDEGLSGISTKKRKHFNEMIEDAKEGKFDLIITKEISRFARNTLDSLQYTRQLLLWGVGVFFQNDNINTLDEDAELRLTIMSSIAQDELRKLSSRVKFGHQQAIKSSIVLGNNRIFGYKKDQKRLVIDETEAPMVRDLFRLYATGEYSLRQLENMFYEQGYRNYNGNKIAHSTMSGIIANPKYKGYYVGNKVRIIDMFTKKQKFLPEEEWVMFKDETGLIVPALVSEELWEKANVILARRSLDVKKRQGICNHSNLLTGKLFCTHCGSPYYRKDSRDKQGNNHSKWVCSGKIKNGATSCPSVTIYESEIKPILFDLLKELEFNIDELISYYNQLYKSLEDDDETNKQIKELEKIIDIAAQKKNKLLELVTVGAMSIESFREMTATCEKEIYDARCSIENLQKQMVAKDDHRHHMAEVRKKLEAAVSEAASGIITKEFIALYIDKIYVSVENPDDVTTLRNGKKSGHNARICLQIQFLMGNSTKKWLENLKFRSRSRTGVTSKKMVESYENSIKNNG